MNQFIEDNIDQLCEYTDVNSTLLTKLTTLGIIADDLGDEIDKQNGGIAKALVLYTHIKRSAVESNYPQIKTALKRSSNARALEFFERNFLEDSSLVSAPILESNNESFTNEIVTVPLASHTSAASADTAQVHQEGVTDKPRKSELEKVQEKLGLWRKRKVVRVVTEVIDLLEPK